MGSTIIQLVLGAIVAILITIWIENLRKPRLKIRIIGPLDNEYRDRPVQSVRFLLVNVTNESLPKWARWMSRNTATQCHGTVTFHHLDGQNVFGRTMSTRWSRSPEPVPTRIVVNDKIILLMDPGKFDLSTRIDIYPGESEELAIVARFDDDQDCYGWSNENYFSDPVWRHPGWKLPPNRYLARVVITTAGERVSEVFRLVNDVSRLDFRLEPRMPNDTLPIES